MKNNFISAEKQMESKSEQHHLNISVHLHQFGQNIHLTNILLPL